MHTHPDHGGDPEEFKRVKEAYENSTQEMGKVP